MKCVKNIVIANASGNITAFVLDETPRYQYEKIADQLLANGEYKAEQVAFVKKIDKVKGPNNSASDGAVGTMEMSGLEFCGNASRSFAMMIAKINGLSGDAVIPIKISGCEEVLDVKLNCDTGYSCINMPEILSITKLDKPTAEIAKDGYEVEMEGITHIIVRNIEPNSESFEKIKKAFYAKKDAAALGVMFMSRTAKYMTPVVYVKGINSTYFEGSCGSGTTAAAAALSADKADGKYHYSFRQPAGNIAANVEVKDGKVAAISIEGPVALSEKITTELEI